MSRAIASPFVSSADVSPTPFRENTVAEVAEIMSLSNRSVLKEQASHRGFPGAQARSDTGGSTGARRDNGAGPVGLSHVPRRDFAGSARAARSIRRCLG